MNKHTPGPWQILANSGSKNEYIIQAKDPIERSGFETWEVCAVPMEHSMDEANARLIAAAPELLRLLKIAVNRLKEHELHPVVVTFAEKLIIDVEGKNK